MKYTFIYCLIDPRNGKVRYIGKANEPKKRLKDHCNPARYKATHKFNWIKQLRELGLKPYLRILEKVLIKDWKIREKHWIRYFIKKGFDLVNYTKGADGLSFGNKTSFKKGNTPWNKNKRCSEIVKKKISNSLKGRKPLHLTKKVIQLTKENKMIKIFNSLTEASIETNTRLSKITLVCQGKRKTTNGFKWKYYEE